MQKNNRSLRWVLSVSKKSLLPVVLLSILGAAMSFFAVRFAVLSKSVVDIATGTAEGALSSAVFALALLMTSQIIIHIIYTVSEVSVSCKLTNSIQKKVFDVILRSDYLSVSSYHSGELVNRLSVDSKTVSDSVMSIIPTVVTLVSQVVFSFAELFRLDFQLAVLCILAFPLVTVGARFYGKRMKPLHKACLTSDGKVKSFVQESVRNILAVKAFLKEQMFCRRLDVLQKENYRLKVKRGIISILANLVFFAVMSFAYYFALIWCAWKISEGLMSVGTLTAVLQLVGILQEPFRKFSGVITGYYSMTASAERLIELEDMPCANEDDEADKTTGEFKQILFDNVSFAYNDDPVLDSADAVIHSGDMVAISGTSGIGKSTFMKLAMGVLTPQDGTVRVVYSEGDYTASPSQSLFSYVPQGNMILSGSIADNITFFESEPDLDMVYESAKLACIHEYIMSLPDGYDTMLGEGGSGLSEGQIQRIAIARALYSERNVIFLDEATSALDAATEADILANIKALHGKTCIIITHRQGALKVADTELVFENGKIFSRKINQ